MDPGLHLPLQRCHDCFLMEAFYTAGYTPKKLGKLNRCRLLLADMTLADICIADGRSIMANACNGIQSFHIQTPVTWPNQGKLPKDDWDLWCLALHQEFFNFYECRHRLQLPLGHWLPDSTTDWIWWYSPFTDRHYKKVSPTTGIVSDVPHGTNQKKKFLMTPTIEPLPTDLRRVTIYQVPCCTEHFRIDGPPGTTLPPHCSCATSTHPRHPHYCIAPPNSSGSLVTLSLPIKVPLCSVLCYMDQRSGLQMDPMPVELALPPGPSKAAQPKQHGRGNWLPLVYNRTPTGQNYRGFLL